MHNYALLIWCDKYGDVAQDLHLWGKYFRYVAKYTSAEHDGRTAIHRGDELNGSFASSLTTMKKDDQEISAVIGSVWGFYPLGQKADLQAYDIRTDNQKYGAECGAMNHVFHQGSCPSCFAFALASALGVRICLLDGKPPSVQGNTLLKVMPSPYRIFDCAGNICEEEEKGLTVQGVMEVMKDGVPDLRETPPIFGWGCRKGEIKSKTFKKVCGSAWIKREIFMNGPVIMPVDLSPSERTKLSAFNEWDDITVQVFHETSSEKGISMHALVILGWSSDPVPHWISKNSWGREWGDSGVGRVPWSSRDCVLAFEPLIDHNEPYKKY